MTEEEYQKVQKELSEILKEQKELQAKEKGEVNPERLKEIDSLKADLVRISSLMVKVHNILDEAIGEEK